MFAHFTITCNKRLDTGPQNLPNFTENVTADVMYNTSCYTFSLKQKRTWKIKYCSGLVLGLPEMGKMGWTGFLGC